MKIAFAGTPEFAATALHALIDAGFDVALVLTQPDRPAGRGMTLQESAVKKLAQQYSLALAQPDKLHTPAQQAVLRACKPDVLVVAAYGLILPQAVLDLPTLGCVNIHASLLPRWRGAAPIHRAIEQGDTETGITIMKMDRGLDTGAMLLRQAIPIASEDTTGSLHDKLATLGAEMIVQALNLLKTGNLPATPQPEEGVSYAHKVTKVEGVLDFKRSAQALARKIRAFNPFPGCSAQLQDGTVIKVWRAHAVASQEKMGKAGQVLKADAQGVLVACGEGALCLTEMQKSGGRRLSAGEFLRGLTLTTSTYFFCDEEA